jgi:hypothetical protein
LTFLVDAPRREKSEGAKAEGPKEIRIPKAEKELSPSRQRFGLRQFPAAFFPTLPS